MAASMVLAPPEKSIVLNAARVPIWSAGAVPRQQDPETQLAVRQQSHRGADDARNAQQLLAAPFVHSQDGVNVLPPIEAELSLSQGVGQGVG